MRKRSLLNGNQMGCILLNRIPGLQLWAGAWPGVLSPWPLVCAEGTWRRGQGVEGGRPRGCDGAASRPQAAGRGSVFLSLCHAVSQPFARISKLEAYQEAILSFLSFLFFFFSISFSLQYNFKGARKFSLFQNPPLGPHPTRRRTNTPVMSTALGALQLLACGTVPVPCEGGRRSWSVSSESYTMRCRI